jgi:hypothetical protein
MNGFGLLFTLVTVYLLLTLPKRWAPLPLLLSAAYIGIGEQLEIGPAHFTVNRILVTAGILRALFKKERVANGWNALDRAMLIWACWAAASIIFHSAGVRIARLGMIFDTFGAYMLFRIFVQDYEDFINISKFVCIIFVPLAGAMLYEKFTGNNLFAPLGGYNMPAELREGHFRARGPFVHQIFAGTVGAVCIPMALLLWRKQRTLSLIGLVATGSIVIASGSTGPLLTTLSIFFALSLWKIRSYVRMIRWLAVALVIALDVVMNDPVYFLMARLDIHGGSTGWYRAALIQSAIKHLNEWWLVGTDYTRNWMPTGIEANQNNADITNYYLQMGVWGGLLLMLLFIWVLVAAFRAISHELRLQANAPEERQFLVWVLGSILFGHAVTFFSIAYFDHQSVVFLYLALAAIGSICMNKAHAEVLLIVAEAPNIEAKAETFAGYE